MADVLASHEARAHRRRRPFAGAFAATAAAASVVLLHSVFGAFVELPLNNLFSAQRTHRPRSLTVQQAERKEVRFGFEDWDSAYNYDEAEQADASQVSSRDVKVSDMRDLNELLRLPDPLSPTENILLMAITLDDGTRIDRPTVQDLRKLNPSKLRPVIFHWKDASKRQTRAPKEYDDIIQRLLNAGPADMEEMVRANWKMFDRGFYFRLGELKLDTPDPRLKEKISNLENMTLDIIKVAQAQMKKTLPDQARDAQDIMRCMLEPEGQLLWPPTPDAYGRLAKEIVLRATRAKYEDGWFETVLEVIERFGQRMQKQDKKELLGMSQIVMQRLITEWLRHDSLWEETEEGQFIYRLMNLSHEQWRSQLMLEKSPLDTLKLRDELKIISENKVVALPMGSKLQIYAAKYLQGLVEFIEKKDDILAKAGANVGSR